MATTRLDPPPIQHPIADQRASFLTPLPWALWFQKLVAGTGPGGEPAFGIVSVQNQDNVDATVPTDTLTLVPGPHITLETNALAKSITISATGTGGEPAPPDTSVQFNDGGVFGGNAAFEFDKVTRSVSIGTGHSFGTTGSYNLLVGSGHQVS
jgi:hypothetical protein